MKLYNIGTLFTGRAWEYSTEIELQNEGPDMDCQGQVVLPGFIDCHTHLVFAGDRALEFEMRSRGVTYIQIMQSGGGILNTMSATRMASKEELIDLALPRLARMQARGVVCTEIKTGYGLSLDAELKILEVIQELNTLQPIELVATFLGAHATPPDWQTEAYVDHVIKDMLPAVCAQGIAEACDVFVEQGAFSVEQARKILIRAKELGLAVRLHAEQLSHSGASLLAAEIGALSASHLEYATEEDALAMAQAGVIAEILPIAQEFLGMKQLASGRMLSDAGVRVAVATDLNPGSAMCDDLLWAARLAVTRGGLTCEEALLGITRYAALAVGRPKLGILEAKQKVSFCLLSTKQWQDLFYDWSVNPIAKIFIR